MRVRQEGMAALMSVVVIGAAVVLIGVSSMLLGVGELNMGNVMAEGQEARSIAEGCVEETLRRIQLDQAYGVGVGTISLNIGNGSCSVVVSDLGSSRRRVLVTGISNGYVKDIVVEVRLSGASVSLDSWSEV